MKFNKILMLDFEDKTLDSSSWKRIDAICEQKVLQKRERDLDKPADVDCLLVNFLPTVDKQLIDSMPRLKYIGILATGYGRIDTIHAASKGIPVCNIPGYSTEAVAEFAFAALLEYLRELERAKKQAREGNYSEASFSGTELKDKKLSVVGLGHIGRRIAELAIGFGMNVCYWSRNRKKDFEGKGARYEELASLMKDCDFISLNLSLNKYTERIINKKLIQSMKPGAVLINLAPMDLIDFDALKQRLKAGDIAFILDHSDEMAPEAVKQLLQYKNCVVYPPIAYTTKEAAAAKQEIFVSNLESFLKGKVRNKVN